MKKLFVMASFLLLSACGSYPYGMTKMEWEALPNYERATLRREEALIKEGKADLIDKTKIGSTSRTDSVEKTTESNQ